MDGPAKGQATPPIWEYIEHLAINTRSDLLLVSSPSYGNVGTTAVRFLIDEGELPLVASIQSDLLPPAATAWQGVVSGPIQVWGRPMPSGPDGACSGLLLLNSDVPIPVEGLMPFAHAAMDWAKTLDVALVVTVEGVARGQPSRGLTAAANLSGEDVANKLGVELPHASLAGLSAAFLMHGNRVGIPVVSLFADAASAEGDPRAALLVLKTLASYVPSMELASKSIETKVHDMSERVAREQLKMQRAARELGEHAMRGYA